MDRIIEIDDIVDDEHDSRESREQELLGWVISAMCLCEKSGVNYAFVVNNVPTVNDTVNDLMVIRQQLYLAIVERAQYFIDLTASKPFYDYLKSLEFLPKLFDDSLNRNLPELVTELEAHMSIIGKFMRQMRFTIRQLELILDNCRKDVTFEDLFDTDVCYRELNSVYECFNCFAEKLNSIISELKNN